MPLASTSPPLWILTIHRLSTRSTSDAYTLRALEIDDGLADAHASLAAIRADYDWDWEGAKTEFQRALELDPKHVNAHQWHAVFLARLGRFNEAVAEIRTAKELDPLSLPVATSAGLILRYARRYDEAIKELQKAIDLEPTFKFTHVELAEVYELKGMFQEAASEWSRVNALSGNPERARIQPFTMLLGTSARSCSGLNVCENLQSGSMFPR